MKSPDASLTDEEQKRAESDTTTHGPFNQCEHPRMAECHPGCGHWSCPDCGLSWDEWGEGGVMPETAKVRP